jgi:hypothetical protein
VSPRFLVAAALAACWSGSTPTSSSPPPPPPSSPPKSAVPGVYAKACATECADDMAELVTYRDGRGAIAIVTVQGSPARCSHPPLRFLGPDGVERAVIPLEPVVPGSDKAKRYQAIHDEQVGGLKPDAETLNCSDVKH